MPTRNNECMNFVFGDSVYKKPACKISSVKCNQRFFTNPVTTVVNNQKKFANQIAFYNDKVSELEFKNILKMSICSLYCETLKKIKKCAKSMVSKLFWAKWSNISNFFNAFIKFTVPPTLFSVNNSGFLILLISVGLEIPSFLETAPKVNSFRISSILNSFKLLSI